MRIQYMNGGLANQLFQYIFVRFAERLHPEETWFIDDSYFFVEHVHNGYELEKIYGIKANLLSNYFDKDVWEEIIRLRKEGVSLPQTFLNMGLPLTMVAETNDYSFTGKVLFTPPNEFHPDILNIQDPNVYYHGFWINKHWFAQYRAENYTELAFPEIIGEKNKQYSDMINNGTSVGIHIRRTGFLDIGLGLPDDYYMTSCKKILDMYPDSQFFVFSDDLDWCKANADALGLNLASHTTYISGNEQETNYIDAQLMSMCQGLILSNSSFCYFAALMNKNLKFWINPTAREI